MKLHRMNVKDVTRTISISTMASTASLKIGVRAKIKAKEQGKK
jgi:hypothetical protein